MSVGIAGDEFLDCSDYPEGPAPTYRELFEERVRMWRDAQARLAEAERQRDELLALVEKAEWTPQCPWCKGYDLGGHRDDCERESTMGSVRGSQ